VFCCRRLSNGKALFGNSRSLSGHRRFLSQSELASILFIGQHARAVFIAPVGRGRVCGHHTRDASDLIKTKEGPIAGMTDLVLKSMDALVAQGLCRSQPHWTARQQPRRIFLPVGCDTNRSLQSDCFDKRLVRYVEPLLSWAAPPFGRFYADEFPYVGDAWRYESTAGSDFGVGRSAWDDPGVYIRNSPVFRAKGVTAPIMLIHSDMDTFPLDQYDEMFTALYRQRKEAAFVRYWAKATARLAREYPRHVEADFRLV